MLQLLASLQHLALSPLQSTLVHLYWARHGHQTEHVATDALAFLSPGACVDAIFLAVAPLQPFVFAIASTSEPPHVVRLASHVFACFLLANLSMSRLRWGGNCIMS